MTSATTLSSTDLDMLQAWLDAEAAAQTELLDLLAVQRTCMVKQDLDGLEALVEKSQTVLRRLEAATRSRAAAFGGLWTRLGHDGEPKLDVILESVPDAQRRALAGAKQRLQGVLSEVQRATRGNQVLARSSLDVNRAIVHAVFAGAEPNTTYDRTAKTRTERPVNACVDREL